MWSHDYDCSHVFSWEGVEYEIRCIYRLDFSHLLRSLPQADDRLGNVCILLPHEAKLKVDGRIPD